MSGIRITSYLLIIMHVLPIAITQLLIMKYPFARQKNGTLIKLVCTAANVLLNGLVLYEVIMYSKFNFLDIMNFTCSYQDISRLATSNIVSLVFSVIIGAGIFMGASRYCKSEHFFHFSSKCVLIILFAAIPIVLGYRYGNSGTSHLAISEICRKTTVGDSLGSSIDEKVLDGGLCYVVVMNNGALSYELDTVYLSADIDELQERKFVPTTTIEPGKVYPFYMESERSIDINSRGGSIVYLSDQFGNLVDSVEVPALNQNQSYISTAAGWQVITLAADEIVTVPAPSFSRESGFYNEAFELELTADPGTTIYYTLDSSNPTAKSTEYSGAIHVYDRSGEANVYRSIRNVRRNYISYTPNATPVDKCFVVRAVAVDSDGNYSDIITKSYFINKDEYKDRNVISLVSDPDGLFGDNGIYVTGKSYDKWYADALANAGEDGKIDSSKSPSVNYLQHGIDWERESYFEVFENADLTLSQPVGIRIQGGSARDLALKRFSIYARKEYGSSEYFDVNLLNDHSQHVLYTRQDDLQAISQRIGQGRDVATTDCMLVDVFLDGEFWYTTYLSEKLKNEKNLSRKYGVSKDNVVAAKYAGVLDVVDGLEDGKNPLSLLVSFIQENDLSDDNNYWKYNEILDIQSYIDWACIQTFMQNMDYWERANNLFWHTIIPENREEGDARWRLGLYDMDLNWAVLNSQFDRISPYEANPFTMIADWDPGPITEWPIYSALRKNEHFCKQFVLTFMDLINTNFSVENTTAIMEEFGITSTSYQTFFENRATYVIPHMAEEFELTGTQETVTLSSNVSGTPITLNTISPELVSSNGTYSWAGSYFTDYPVTVTANASNFSYWEVTANGSVQKFTDKTIEVPVSKGGVQIHAVFR